MCFELYLFLPLPSNYKDQVGHFSVEWTEVLKVKYVGQSYKLINAIQGFTVLWMPVYRPLNSDLQWNKCRAGVVRNAKAGRQNTQCVCPFTPTLKNGKMNVFFFEVFHLSLKLSLLCHNQWQSNWRKKINISQINNIQEACYPSTWYLEIDHSWLLNKFKKINI